MPVVQFASMRVQLPPLQVAVVSGGNLTGSGTLFFSVQGRNRPGFNLPSTVVSATYSPGEKIVLTLPATLREDGEDIHWFVISGGLTNNPSEHVQIAIYQGYEADQVTKRTLPVDIELTEDEHLLLSATVSSLSNFPQGSNLLTGMLRGVINEAKIYRYDDESSLTPDGSTIVSATPDPGNWVQYGAFSTYVTNTQDLGGSDVPLGVEVADLITAPTHPGDGSIGTFVRLWWYAFRNEGVGITEIGKRFGFYHEVQGVNRSANLDSQMELQLNGYVRLSDGTLDVTDIPTGQQTYKYGKLGAILIEKDIPSGYAVDWGIAPAIDLDTLPFSLPNGAQISSAPFVFNQSGTPNPIGRLTGDTIYNDPDFRHIVPGQSLTVVALSGTGNIKDFSFVVGQTLVVGLQSNTAEQVLSINGDGTVIPRGVSPTLDDTEVVRAIVGTLAGQSNVSTTTGFQAVGVGEEIDVTINHPVTVDDFGIIRADYPDTKIASNDKGQFNPSGMVIYGVRQSDGEIREFSGYIPLISTSQVVSIENWSDGVVVAQIPTNPDSFFSLYSPQSVTFVSAAGFSDFLADNYEFYVAYSYTGNQVTEIDHTNGVYQNSRTASEWDQTADEWLSNKNRIKYLDERQNFTTANQHTPASLVSSSGALDVDFSLSNSITHTLVEDITAPITASNVLPGSEATFELINPGNTYSVSSWDSAFTWVGGTEPTTPEDFAVYRFHSFDGVTIRAWEAGVGSPSPSPSPTPTFDFDWILVDSGGDVITSGGNVLVSDSQGATIAEEVIVDSGGDVVTSGGNLVTTGSSVDWDVVLVDSEGNVITSGGNVVTSE